MKQLMLLIASLFLSVSFANANLIQNDLNLAFGGDVKTSEVTLLDDSQMSNIKGKGWGRSFRRAFHRVKRSVKKIGRKIHWNRYRYRYLAIGFGVGMYFYTGGYLSFNSPYYQSNNYWRPTATGFRFTYPL